MIDNYEDIMKQWSKPDTITTCCNNVSVYPKEDMERWSVQQRAVYMLANADYYYTKSEVDSLLEQISASGVTREQVEQMIQVAIQTKADKAEVEALAAQVSANTQAILNTYTKQETDSLLDRYLTKLRANQMFANYSKVDGTTLELNAENITV